MADGINILIPIIAVVNCAGNSRFLMDLQACRCQESEAG